MKWYQNLYIGEHIQGKQDTIIQYIKEQKPVLGIYLLVIDMYIPHPNLEIIYNHSFFHGEYQMKEYMIVGIAKGKLEAFRLVQKLVEKYLQVYTTQGENITQIMDRDWVKFFLKK